MPIQQNYQDVNWSQEEPDFVYTDHPVFERELIALLGDLGYSITKDYPVKPHLIFKSVSNGDPITISRPDFRCRKTRRVCYDMTIVRDMIVHLLGASCDPNVGTRIMAVLQNRPITN